MMASFAALLGWAKMLSAQSVVISEVMYQPPGGSAYAEAEFLELFNPGSQPADLSGASFSTGITFKFPSPFFLKPNAWVVVCRNLAVFTARYGPVTGLVAGSYSGALNNGGETLVLNSASGAILAQIKYGIDGDWPTRPAGLGGSIELVDPLADPTAAANWRASAEYFGSPGSAGAGVQNRVVINELLAHTDPPLEDAVELFNRTEQPINVGGWFLSNDLIDPFRFRIPAGTVVPPRGFRIIYEYQFNPLQPAAGRTAFTFGAARGGMVTLLSTDAVGSPHRWEDVQEFPASPNGVSFGLHPDGEGPFQLMQRMTLGTGIDNSMDPLLLNIFRQGLGGTNAPHALGPVVFRRLRYAAPAGEIEFVELENVSAETVPMYDPAYPTNGWRIEGGISFAFSEPQAMAPGAKWIVANTNNSAAVRRLLGASDAQIVLGPYIGQLASGGERLSLVRPDTPQLPPRPDAGFVPYFVVEQLDYKAVAPWPAEAALADRCLARIASTAPAYLPSNWRAEAILTINPTRPTVVVERLPGQQVRLRTRGPLDRGYVLERVTFSGASTVPVTAPVLSGSYSVPPGTLQTDGSVERVFELTAGESAELWRIRLNP
ncbi:MAG: lamin tail domain-containing protein [Verrucomicrobia bacterium]|nr:lamin tail domain-containing protein [Verrucomicrobiota bacterium]